MKIFVIEDEEKFRTELNLATIQSTCLDMNCLMVADAMRLLENYEQDVIGFEAEVHVSNESNHMPHLVISSGGELDHLLTEETLQVFVVKPKKPEVVK